MKCFSRYPHVKDLINYYAAFFSESFVSQQLESGVSNPQEAEKFSLFIWKMVDQMRRDSEENTVVLGSTDNSEMLQDIYYEISEFMFECGFESVWERVSEEV
jgi:hypothetical protein